LDTEGQLLGEPQELRRRRVQREHALGLHARHAGDRGDLLERRRRQEATRGEARAHPHPPPRHGDLAEDEAVAALDEAHDALAHGAQRDESGDTERDTRDRERVAVEDSAETYHSKRDSTGRSARRRIQTFTRAIENRSRSDARARHDMPRKAPPDNTLSTASTMPNAVLGLRNSS